MPTRLGGGRGPETEHVRDQLSAYIDYELSDVERAQVREHLRRCPECENELATLKATKQLLVEMAAQPAPHSFVLTPDMVGRAVSGPIVVRRPGWSLAARLRLASAAFAFLLVFMLSVEVLFQGSANALPAQSAFPSLGMPETNATGPETSGALQNQDRQVPGAAQATVTIAAAYAAPTATTATAAADTTTNLVPPAAPMPTNGIPATGGGAMPPPEPTGVVGVAEAPSAAATPLPPGAGGAVPYLTRSPDDKLYLVVPGDQATVTQSFSIEADRQAATPVGPTLDAWRLAEVTALALALALALGSLWAARRQA